MVDLLDQPQMKSDLNLIPVVGAGAARVDDDRVSSEQSQAFEVISELSSENDSAIPENMEVVKEDSILRDLLNDIDNSQQWPSIAFGEEIVEEGVLKEEGLGEKEWPSIVSGEEIVEESVEGRRFRREGMAFNCFWGGDS